MWIATLISLAAGITVGILSCVKERSFIILLFGGILILAVLMHYMGDFGPKFKTAHGSSSLAIAQDFFSQIPEDKRLAAIIALPAFILGRILTWAYISARPDPTIMTGDKMRAKKKRILKSYGMQ